MFVCSYIYCEVLTVNDETAASLLYAAKKYMVSKLVRECQNYLSGSLSVNNVIEFLEQSLLFHDDELKSKCLKLLAWNAEAVLRGTKIMAASTQSVETILDMDNIPVREIVLYETCLAWTKYQLKIEDSTEDPTYGDIRKKLGDLLYKIRFPTMELTEFADISDGQNVLRAEEKASIFYFLAKKKKGSQLLFPTERRGPKYFVDRTVTCENERWSWSGADAITFTTNRDILLTGIGLYTGYNGNGYAVDIETLKFFESLFKKRCAVPATGDENQFQVLIDVPIRIKAGLRYSVKATPDASIGHYGDPCQDVCTKENVTFTFSGHMDSGKTSQARGQIPRLYFCY